MKLFIVLALIFITSISLALDYAIPTQKGAAIVSGSSSEMKNTPNYGYPVSPTIKALPEKYRIIVGHTVREKTPAEKAAIDDIMVTNIAYKTSAVTGEDPVVEAEQIYVGLYMTLFGNQGYTNAEWNTVAAQLAFVAVTNDWVAARTDLMQSSFSIMSLWWENARSKLGLQEQGFHPYPWGHISVTNVVQKYP